jgi:hypothetical protein
VRLTLRTLLAYLDDTLEPAQARLIGQKMSESEAAQGLVARIKQVTRRRRLMVPNGPGAKIDSNTIAEYLDNVLPAEQLAEVEEACLDSDVHLAEVAACHQILTLVLGEPMLVPPTARQRMYGLKQGRESIRKRKATATAIGQGELVAAGTEAEEGLLLGKLLAHPNRWTHWLVPLTAACLLVAAALLIWMAMTSNLPSMLSARGKGTPEVPVLARNGDANAEPAPEPEKKTPSETPVVVPQPKAEAEAKKEASPSEKKETTGKSDKPAESKPARKPPAPVPVQPPRTERRELGKYVLQAPGILLQQPQEKGAWQRVRPESPISSTDYLVSLPGYRSELRLDSGVHLLLWGNLPEFSRIPVLESAVMLHVNPALQLDFTLDHGRVVLSNDRKDPAHVRVRFADEVWDLTLLDQNSEVALEMGGVCVPYSRGTTGGEPELSLALLALKGEAELKVRYERFLLTGPSLFIWDNISGSGHEARPLEHPPDWWVNKIPTKSAMQPALEALTKRLIAKDSVDVAIAEMLKDADAPSRTLALRCLGAMGELSPLVDSLNNDRHPDVAIVGRQELLHFLGLSPKNDARLLSVLKQKNYSEGQAQIVMQLLHGFSQEQWTDATTRTTVVDYLLHDKLTIRHLSYLFLLTMVPDGRNIAYNPTADVSQRERGAEEWRKFLLNPKGAAKRNQKGPGG